MEDNNMQTDDFVPKVETNMTLFTNQEKTIELTAKDFDMSSLNLNYIKPEPSPGLRSSKFDYLLLPQN